jgi:hypothetical protein
MITTLTTADELPPCYVCGKNPILAAEHTAYELAITVRFGCPSRKEGHPENSINLGAVLGSHMVMESIRAAIPQMGQWWKDAVAMHHAAEAMKVRLGRARGRPGLRPAR